MLKSTIGIVTTVKLNFWVIIISLALMIAMWFIGSSRYDLNLPKTKVVKRLRQVWLRFFAVLYGIVSVSLIFHAHYAEIKQIAKSISADVGINQDYILIVFMAIMLVIISYLYLWIATLGANAKKKRLEKQLCSR